MGHTLVIELPESVYQRLERAATAVGKSVDQVVVANLSGEPLSLEPNLEEPYRSELIGMATWSDEALTRAMEEVMPRTRQRRHELLLRRARERQLTAKERAELDALREEGDRLMLRKARAGGLLLGRGRAVPPAHGLPTPE